MWFDIIIIILILIVFGIQIRATIEERKIKKRLQRVDGDINTLHYNEGVILSSVNELAKEMRKHEKKTRVVQRSLRAIPKEGESQESNS